MMRSGYHDLFDAHLATGRARAERAAALRAMAQLQAEAMRAFQALGVSFKEASIRMQRALETMQRGGRQLP